ncbi:hypothetical protein [Bradyrhizobium genosp. P]|uniref:hypothetical protein n=1 Tax=Bradyrhizobium genosp. P TaxID=83641 RepID=UPI003CF5CE8D
MSAFIRRSKIGVQSAAAAFLIGRLIGMVAELALAVTDPLAYAVERACHNRRGSTLPERSAQW